MAASKNFALRLLEEKQDASARRPTTKDQPESGMK
jgi:hypothetical protein